MLVTTRPIPAYIEMIFRLFQCIAVQNEKVHICDTIVNNKGFLCAYFRTRNNQYACAKDYIFINNYIEL